MSLADEIRESQPYARALIDVVSAQGLLSVQHAANLVHIAAIVSGLRLARDHYTPSELATFLRDMADYLDREIN